MLPFDDSWIEFLGFERSDKGKDSVKRMRDAVDLDRVNEHTCIAQLPAGTAAQEASHLGHWRSRKGRPEQVRCVSFCSSQTPKNDSAWGWLTS